LEREGLAVWEPIILPTLPGRLVAVSEPAGDKLAVCTEAGVSLLRLGRPAQLLESLPPQRGFQRFDRTEGCFRWRGVRYPMHGRCGSDGEVVGEPLLAQQRLGQTIERRLRYVEYGWWHLYPNRTQAELRRRFPLIDLK
jgi:hypothetical protein